VLSTMHQKGVLLGLGLVAGGELVVMGSTDMCMNQLDLFSEQ